MASVSSGVASSSSASCGPYTNDHVDPDHQPSSSITSQFCSRPKESSSTLACNIPHMLVGLRNRPLTIHTQSTSDDTAAAVSASDEGDYLHYWEDYYYNSSVPLCEGRGDELTHQEESDEGVHSSAWSGASTEANNCTRFFDPMLDDMTLRPPPITRSKAAKRTRSIGECSHGPPSIIRVTAVSSLTDQLNDKLTVNSSGTAADTAAAIDPVVVSPPQADTDAYKESAPSPLSLIQLSLEITPLEDDALQLPPPPPLFPQFSRTPSPRTRDHHTFCSPPLPSPSSQSITRRPRKHHRRSRGNIVFCGGLSSK